MSLFNRNKPPQAPPTPELEPAAPAIDWSDIKNIRAEWPRTLLDPERDLHGFQQATALYERDDYPAMMQCATLFSNALAHSLYGPGILTGSDLPETVHKTMYCSLTPPPDGQTFADSAQKALRLAMTLMRENGWHPPQYGGTDEHFAGMMQNSHFLLAAAIAPPDQPWAGDLKVFFSVAPQPTFGDLPDPKGSEANALLDRMEATIADADSGDHGSSVYMEALRLSAAGDIAGALDKCKEAGQLGSVDAMAEAGALAGQLGLKGESDFWYEAAANAGHPIAMFNTAVVAIQGGDRPGAATWFQKAAEAGNIEGYAALTQLADEEGNEAAEAHWSKLGAESGHLFCMGRYGLLLARGANGDVPTMRRARDLLEQAAERGDLQSASLAINLNHQLNDAARAQRFVTLVVQSGDAEAIDRLRRFGFL